MKKLKNLLVCVLAVMLIGVVLALPIGLVSYAWVLYACMALDLHIAIIVTLINIVPIAMWIVAGYIV